MIRLAKWIRGVSTTLFIIPMAATMTSAAVAEDLPGIPRTITIPSFTLAPQRPDVVDAYVVVIGMDADDVFTREATAVADILTRRYQAEGRTILLTAGNGDAAPEGHPEILYRALEQVATTMDREQDVLILYTTSHGIKGHGIVYRDEDFPAMALSPATMAGGLQRLGFVNRLLIISACYSGQFLEPLSNPTSIVLTAASKDRNSFGCAPGNDWTFFGHALLNQAMRKPVPLAKAVKTAHKQIAGWEKRFGLEASNPQQSFGAKTHWLAKIEHRLPAATPRIGRDPTATLE